MQFRAEFLTPNYALLLLSLMINEMEIENILAEARRAVSDNQCLFRLGSGGITEQFACLNVGDVKEVWPLVLELLNEIRPKNYLPHPTQAETIGNRLFKFAWKSRKMRRRMQIKFAIHGGTFYYYSLCFERRQKSECQCGK